METDVKMKKPILYQKWYKCPNCGQKFFLYDNTAQASGIYVKCKACKKSVEVIIKH